VSRFVGQRLLLLLAKNSKEDLLVLKELIEAGKVTPVIGRRYPLSEAPEAIRCLEAGHAQGKTVITVWIERGGVNAASREHGANADCRGPIGAVLPA
jgi:hypothetical protein